MGKFIIFYCLVMIGFVSQNAFAAHTFEAEPGILEMTTSNAHGFVIQSFFEKKVHGKKHVYFCLKEVKGNVNRCFYGRKSDFNVLKTGFLLNGIQYKLKDRFHNKNGRIPLKSASYFYQATVIRPQT